MERKPQERGKKKKKKKKRPSVYNNSVARSSKIKKKTRKSSPTTPLWEDKKLPLQNKKTILVLKNLSIQRKTTNPSLPLLYHKLLHNSDKPLKTLCKKIKTPQLKKKI